MKTPNPLLLRTGRQRGSSAITIEADDEVLRLQDYLEHIELAIARFCRYVAGLDRASFLASEEKQDAVIRNDHR